MPISHAFAQARAASPILVNEMARIIDDSDHPMEELKKAGVCDAISGHLVLVRPADNLAAYRVVHSGQAIDARFGANLTGSSFADILDLSGRFRRCLSAFEQASKGRSVRQDSRRVDFSNDWIVEYPVLSRPS